MLGMSLEGAHASVISGLPYGESSPWNGASSPSAYYYNGRTYVTWQGADLDPYVAYYTSATRNWTGLVRAGDNPLIGDNHGAPAILVDNSGYIHIMYGSHGTAQKYAKSTNPEDISAWTAMPDPLGAIPATYPHLLKDSSGYLHLIYKSGISGSVSYSPHEDIITSTNGGATWSAPQQLINPYDTSLMESIYLLGGGVEYESATNRIHLAWVRYNGAPPPYTNARLNVYYAYLNLNENNMYAVDGTNLGSTIDQTEADAYCKVVDSGGHQTNQASVNVDSTGKPYIIYENGDSVTGVFYYYFTRWTGSAWTTPVSIIDASGDGGAAFFVHSSQDIEAYLAVWPHSDIERWSWNGTTWAKVSAVLVGPWVSRYPYYLQFPTPVVNGVDLKIVFCETNGGPDEYTLSNLRIFAYDDASQFIVKRRS